MLFYHRAYFKIILLCPEILCQGGVTYQRKPVRLYELPIRESLKSHMSYLSAKAITCLLTNTGDKTIIGIINAGEDRMEQTLQQIKTDRTKSRYLRAFKAAFPYTIPVLTGFAALGIAYGLLMASNGYGVLWAFLMSTIGFGGSVQYAMVPLLTTVFDPLQAFLLSFMINARHLFYGLSMLGKYKGLGKKRFFLIFALCDETFSVVSSVEPPEDVEKGLFYFFITFLDYFYWSAATVAGALIGGMITFDTTGLDFVLTALFVVLFMEQMKKKENRSYGMIGIAGAVVAAMIFGSENMVIPSMIIIMAVLLFMGKSKKTQKEDA